MKAVIVSVLIGLSVMPDVDAAPTDLIRFNCKSPDSAGKERRELELQLDGIKKLEQEELSLGAKIQTAKEKVEDEKPVWQTKADSASAVAKQIFADHHNKHPEGSSELAYWRQQLAQAVTATNQFMDKADALDKTYADLVAERERVLAEKFARVREVVGNLKAKGIPCAKELDENASYVQLKFCGMVYFDGADPNLPVLPEGGRGTGTNFFSSEAVVVPEYNRKDALEKQRKIDEMIRTSTAPVKKPIVVEPPSPGQTNAEPTATDRLKEAMRKFRPKPKSNSTAVTSVRG